MQNRKLKELLIVIASHVSTPDEIKKVDSDESEDDLEEGKGLFRGWISWVLYLLLQLDLVCLLELGA